MIPLLELLCCFLVIASSAAAATAAEVGTENEPGLRGNDPDALSLFKHPNVPCESDDDCSMENSKCNGNGKQRLCDCREGYVLDGTWTRCLKVATAYGETCEENIQCSEFLSVGGACERNACACKDGYHYLHGRCHESRGLGVTCTNNEECFASAEYGAAGCIDGRCSCRSSSYYQREYSACRRLAKEVGDDCILDTDCASVNTTCINNKCINEEYPDNIRYSNEFVTSSADLDVQIGSNCTKNDDCQGIKNSICGPDKVCICNKAYFPSKSLKNCVPEIGEQCNPGSESEISYSECRDGTWTCKYDRVNLKNNKLCRKLTMKIGDGCQYQENCQLFGPRANCVEDKCACDSSSHWVESESFCWINKNIDEACRSNNDCYAPENSPRTVCKSKGNGSEERVCSCPDDARLSVSKTYCVRNVPELGSYCEDDVDCEIVDSTCRDAKCKCRENYFESGGECLVGLNATCKTNDDCKLNNTECSTNICQCQTNFVANPNGECIPVAGHNETCEHDVQCTAKVGNSFCSKKTLPAKEINPSGICECLSGYYRYDENNCYVKKSLGELCTREAECLADNDEAVCRNGMCVCNFGYKRNNQTCLISGENSGSASIRPWLVLQPLAVAFLALKSLR